MLLYCVVFFWTPVNTTAAAAAAVTDDDHDVASMFDVMHAHPEHLLLINVR